MPEEGQQVSINPKLKSRAKYEAAFADYIQSDPSFLDDLTVEKVLPDGDIVVRHRSKTPFVVRKTHLVKKR
jgi:3-methyladenine DNA glycosylase Tag